GGQAMDQDEAVQYSAVTDSGTLYVDEGIFNANENLDGLSTLSNGNIALSTADSASIGGTGFEDGDIVEVTLDGTFVQLLFDEDEFTGNEDIDAVYVRENGNIILSTTNAANFDPGAGGLAMDDDDLVEWNPNTGTATLFFDLGSVVGNGENVDGVYLLNDDPDLILFSLADNRTLGGTDYEDGDVILYNRNTG